MRLQGFSPKDRQLILGAQKHTENVARIMDEWKDATGTEATGKDYEEYYSARIKELEK
ncbi:hypothetical protein [Anaerovibrio sp. RM50]|uniref:hypothetical protein n=1 Tax=Anaerovibrio sp. RM50 TaxID=1200557 RepID=UPI0012EC8C93|nr:hypothetical protein [Anaerovibrio sp. RM50]